VQNPRPESWPRGNRTTTAGWVSREENGMPCTRRAEDQCPSEAPSRDQAPPAATVLGSSSWCALSSLVLHTQALYQQRRATTPSLRSERVPHAFPAPMTESGLSLYCPLRLSWPVRRWGWKLLGPLDRGRHGGASGGGRELCLG
jgi:hypothetical protein